MRVLVAMSGGVDSSVAAALLVEQGHEVVGVTLKLWGGRSDSGCCSVADVDDARRVAQQLGIDHWVFRFTDDFEAKVVEPYAAAHADGRTPNPCVECNRHLKFDRLLARAEVLGFDALATGHHARIRRQGPHFRLLRGVDPAKDQSYVLYMLGQRQLGRVLFPVGEMTKAEVRRRAAELQLRTADKPESQDVCFVLADGGRAEFLAPRIALHPGRVVDTEGELERAVEAVELVTVGQRRGLGSGGGRRRYVVAVDTGRATVTVGPAEALRTDGLVISAPTWTDRPPEGPVLVQCGAHATPRPGRLDGHSVWFDEPQRRVAPGQSVVLYDGDTVLGGGIAG